MASGAALAGDALRRKKKNREKLVVEFDEDARREFLTGFSRRKKERRKRALQQLEARAKDERLAARKEIRDRIIEEKRKAAETMLQGVAADVADSEDESSARVVEALASKSEKVDQFVDDFTEHAFGSALVTVTTTVPDGEAESRVDKAQSALEAAIQKEMSHIRLPKHSKIAQGETARLANSMRDKLKSRKKKGKTGPTARSKGKKRR